LIYQSDFESLYAEIKMRDFEEWELL